LIGRLGLYLHEGDEEREQLLLTLQPYRTSGGQEVVGESFLEGVWSVSC